MSDKHNEHNLISHIRDRFDTGNSTTAYVCENYVCQEPTTDVDAFVELLQ